MRLLPIVLLPSAALLALSGCTLVPHGPLVPYGPLVTEDRDIAAVTSLVLDSAGDVTVTVGEPSLVIHAPREVLDRLTSTVKDGVLVLGVKRGISGFLPGDISYDLTVPSLDSIELNGSGDINSDVPGERLGIDLSGSGDLDIAGIDASSVTVDISGSGTVSLSGRTDELAASLSGSGEVHADDLDSARVSIDLGGSGDIGVAASDTLDVSISGTGSVRYVGRPEVTQDISGSGEVSAG